LAICGLILKIKSVALTFRSIWLWFKRRKADKKLTKNVKESLELIDREIGGVKKEEHVEFLSSASDLNNRVQKINEDYSIALNFREKFSREYAYTWADLERLTLVKNIETCVYPHIKELLPIPIAVGFDLYLAYHVATKQRKHQVARGIREHLLKISMLPHLEKINDYFKAFETLHNAGNLLNVVLPVFEDIYELNKLKITETLREECAKFIEWAAEWARTPVRIDIPPFLEAHIRVKLVPIFEKNWAEYATLAIKSIETCDHVFFCSSQRHKFKALEAALGSKLLAPKFRLGINRLIITKEALYGGTSISVQIVKNADIIEEKMEKEILKRRIKLAQKDKVIVVREDDWKNATKMAINTLKRHKEILVENDERAWPYLNNVIFDIIHKTEAKISSWGFERKEQSYIAMLIMCID